MINDALPKGHTFPVSANVLTRLHQEAAAMGMTVATRFRMLAWAMLRDKTPAFDVSGRPTEKALYVSMFVSLSEPLRSFCARLDIPFTAAGELVCSYVLNAKSEAV